MKPVRKQTYEQMRDELQAKVDEYQALCDRTRHREKWYGEFKAYANFLKNLKGHLETVKYMIRLNGPDGGRGDATMVD